MKSNDRKDPDGFWEKFDATPAYSGDTGEAQELAESQAFKIATMKVLDEAFAGNNDHAMYLERSKRIVEQLGVIVDDYTDPKLLQKAHQAYYLAFAFADVDFIEGSGDVEGVFNQRALGPEEFKQAAMQARERLDANPTWERKLYTSLPLFTETAAERYIARAVFSVAVMQIAHWQVDQSSIGEVKRLTAWHLRQRFGALVTRAAEQDTAWADTIADLEVKMRAAST